MKNPNHAVLRKCTLRPSAARDLLRRPPHGNKEPVFLVSPSPVLLYSSWIPRSLF